MVRYKVSLYRNTQHLIQQKFRELEAKNTN